MKILMIRFSSIGDLILTTPAVRYIKTIHPDATIDFLTRSEWASLLAHNPRIDHIFPFDAKTGFSGLNRLKREIVARKYDWIIDLHGNLRSRWITLFTRKKVTRYKKNQFRRFLLVHFGINLYTTRFPLQTDPPRILHVAEKYLKACGYVPPLEPDPSLLRPEFPIAPTIKTKGTSVAKKLMQHGYQVVVAPGARHFTKRWPAEYYAEWIASIYKKFRIKTVLVGGPDEISLIEMIRNICDPESKYTTTLAGNLSLLETIAVIARFPYFISNDSGLMHAAAAFDVQQIALFGSSVRELGFTPLNPHARIIETAIGCRPCSHIGREACPRAHFDCMKKITPRIAFSAFEELKKG